MVDDWVSVPTGTVLRGSTADEVAGAIAEHADLELPASWLRKELLQAERPVKGFFLMRVPVTVAQFHKFCVSTGIDHGSYETEPDDPAHGITFAMAQAFCRWESERTSHAVRLLTELEWERAARGSDGRTYPWGEHYDPTRCNLAEAGLGRPMSVYAHPTGASPFGILDMAGNVDEWTCSPYAAYENAPSDVPGAESWALDPHVTRGGAWYHHRDLARCARRHGVYHRYDGVGLRLASDHAPA